jgi:MinD superfamily P-loop ATPase
MKIAVTGGKGGVGKSTVAVSLAVELAQKNKTMLVDADAECPNDHILLSIKREKYTSVYQLIPKWDFKKCLKCGKCAFACKQNAIAFVPGKYPAFAKDACIGCGACISACPYGAIKEAKKEIGKIYRGKNYKVDLVSGELKLGELASGEVVAEVRKKAEEIRKKTKNKFVVIDSSPGIGCPVIASLRGTDYIVAVTESTPSALFDLKRVLYLADYFKTKSGIIINKFSPENKFCREVEKFAERKKIPVLGKIPYENDFIKATLEMKPVVEVNPEYKKIFNEIIKKIKLL